MAVVCCWSAKGGVGATVVAAGLALAGAHGVGAPTLLVDLVGDLPLTLGIDAPGAGLSAWSDHGADAPPDALRRLAVPVVPGVALLPRGDGPLSASVAEVLIALLAASGRTVICDVGRLGAVHHLPTLGTELVARCDTSLLVSGTDAVSLGRSGTVGHPTDGVVLVGPQRPTDRRRVARAALPAPVLAELELDPRVRAAVTGGLVHRALPAAFHRSLVDLRVAILGAPP